MVHFKDLINNGNISARQEIDCITELLNKKDSIGVSISDLFDDSFIRFSQKGAFSSLKDLIDFLIKNGENKNESLILICEMLLIYIHEYRYLISSDNLESDIFSFPCESELNIKYLERHIYSVVDRIHHKVVTKNNDEFIIIQKKRTQSRLLR